MLRWARAPHPRREGVDQRAQQLPPGAEPPKGPCDEPPPRLDVTEDLFARGEEPAVDAHAGVPDVPDAPDTAALSDLNQAEAAGRGHSGEAGDGLRPSLESADHVRKR